MCAAMHQKNKTKQKTPQTGLLIFFKLLRIFPLLAQIEIKFEIFFIEVTQIWVHVTL